MEFPSAEMKRLIREIGGKAHAGEKDEQLRARATRRMNMDLPGDRQISERRGKSYWHGETDDIPSDHMDRARELASVQPLQEAEDAITNLIDQVEKALPDLLHRLADAASSARRGVGIVSGVSGTAAGARRAPRGSVRAHGRSVDVDPTVSRLAVRGR